MSALHEKFRGLRRRLFYYYYYYYYDYVKGNISHNIIALLEGFLCLNIRDFENSVFNNFPLNFSVKKVKYFSNAGS
jgi:hypothetical protein